MELGVEAEDAAAEQPGEELVAPGADPEPLRVGPRDVPERDHRGPGQPLADHPRQQREVVVLDEDDRVVGVHLLADRVGELPVHRLVVAPVLAAEDAAGCGRCGTAARGPRSRSRSSSPSPPRGRATPVGGRRTPRPAGPAAGRSRPRPRGRAEPLPWATQTPEQARMTGSSAVTRPLAGWTTRHLAVARALVDVGLAVRDDHHPLAVQVAAQRVLEPLRRPEAAQAVRLPLRGEALDQVAHVAEEGPELGRRALAPDEPPQLVAPAPPREPRGDEGDDRRREREEAEGQHEEAPRGRLPPLDEAQVVDEDHEAQGLVAVEPRGSRSRGPGPPAPRRPTTRSSRPRPGSRRPDGPRARGARTRAAAG